MDAHYTALLAKSYEIAGQLQEALTLFEEAFEFVTVTGERWFAAELHRHEGRLLSRQGHIDAAEQLF